MFKQPELPYALSDLSPVLSEETLKFHYGIHEKTYIDNLNKLIVGTPFEQKTLEEIITGSNGPIFNNAAQTYNHIFYFGCFSVQGGGMPDGALLDAIKSTFGSFEKFQEIFETEGTKLFGSGWVWLVKDERESLSIMATGNAGNPLTNRLSPILCFDLWEHAYYIDYRNRRAEYLHKLWDIVDWNKISQRFAK